jgi:hypothetical protein
MLEAFTDPPARSCYFPASKTGMSRFQLVDPDLSACVRASASPRRIFAGRRALRTSLNITSVDTAVRSI